MVNTEELIQNYSEIIRAMLKSLNINDIRVEDKLQHRSAEEFKNQLLIAREGLNHVGNNDIPLLINTKDIEYGGLPIRYIIIPELMKGFLYTNNEQSVFAADIFYLYEQKQIIPIKTTKPVALQGLIPFKKGIRYRELGTLADSLICGPILEDLVDNKFAALEVIRKAGLNKRKYEYLKYDDEEVSLEEKLYEFTKEGIRDIVIKSDNGIGGHEVRLFTDKELDQAAKFGNKLLKRKRNILIEERVHALEIYDEDRKLLDWNIRALVTVGDNPQWIDGFVRINQKNGYPINLDQGAKAISLEEVMERTGTDINQIKNAAIQYTTIFCDEARKKGEQPRGLLGLDLMASKNEIALIEPNGSNSGGFASLTKINKKRIEEAIRNILFPQLGIYLAERYKLTKKKKYKWFPFERTVDDFYTIMENLRENENRTAMISVGYRAKKIYQNNPIILRALGTLFLKEQKYGIAKRYFSKALQGFTDNLEDYAIERSMSTMLLAVTIYEHSGDYFKAKELFRRSYNYGGNNQLNTNYAWFLICSDNEDLTTQLINEGIIKKMIIEEPHNPYLQLYLGDTYERMDKSEDALECYQKAIKMNENKENIIFDKKLADYLIKIKSQ